jgi:transposase-like protein
MEAYRMAKKKRNPANAAVIAHISDNYEIKSVLDIQEALKDMFGGAMEQMLAGELDAHLGYDRHEKTTPTDNRRNGTSSKTVRSQLGEIELEIPRDRAASFEPQFVPKHQKDLLGIEDRVLAMYAKEQSQRDITATIQDIYGFNISHENVSKISERIVPLVHEFMNRALKKFYPFVFVDAMYTPVKPEAGAGQKGLYNMVGIDVDGHKDVLGFWLSEDESSRQCCLFPSTACRDWKMPSKPSIRRQPHNAVSSI